MLLLEITPVFLTKVVFVFVLIIKVTYILVLIFVFELRHKLLDKFILVINDLLAGLFLNFNVLKR